MLDFGGKRIVVTGGSRGIGEAISRAFAERGARVAILARNLETASATAERLGENAKAWAIDVSEPSSVSDTFGSVLEEFGGVDVLVNNAGVTRDKLLMAMSVEDWDTVLGINLRGTYLCSKAVVRPMLKQRSGRIINITSVVGLSGNPGQANYSASKAGIIGFTKSLARELASRSITVNAIAPGMIDTDMTRNIPEKVRDEICASIPMGRMGTADDIAMAALYLAGEGAGYVTGEVLRVDGGMAT